MSNTIPPVSGSGALEKVTSQKSNHSFELQTTSNKVIKLFNKIAEFFKSIGQLIEAFFNRILERKAVAIIEPDESNIPPNMFQTYATPKYKMPSNDYGTYNRTNFQSTPRFQRPFTESFAHESQDHRDRFQQDIPRAQRARAEAPAAQPEQEDDLAALSHLEKSLNKNEALKTIPEGLKRTQKISSKDPYSLLGLNKNATRSEIRKVYKELVMSLHPDKFQGSDEELGVNNTAFKLLKDAYESLLEKHKNDPQQPHQAAPAPQQPPKAPADRQAEPVIIIPSENREPEIVIPQNPEAAPLSQESLDRMLDDAIAEQILDEVLADLPPSYAEPEVPPYEEPPEFVELPPPPTYQAPAEEQGVDLQPPAYQAPANEKNGDLPPAYQPPLSSAL